MKHLSILLILFCLGLHTFAQQNLIYDTDNFRSLQLIAGGDVLLPPVLGTRKVGHIEIGFDEMSHDYRRLRYHIDHCEADWTVSEYIFESDYLAGLNDQLIEDSEKSFNTTQIYTHYSLTLPNQEARLLLSGNYRVTVYDEDDRDNPVLKAEFCLVKQEVGISATVSGNTDIDFQQQHQQLAIDLRYNGLRVNDPKRELKVLVTQNRRQDLMREVHPNMQNNTGVQFSHQTDLIFPGGNECHSFELLNLRGVNAGVDNIRWYDPYYHVTLNEEFPTRHYSLETDRNGSHMIDNRYNENQDTESEYAYVHFRLKTPPLNGAPLYVHGNWVNQWPSDEYKMEYNTEDGEYQAAILLKQGYYDYRFLQWEGRKSTSAQTDGNFYQTLNDYQIWVYYKEPGGRYDRLVGFYELKMDN